MSERFLDDEAKVTQAAIADLEGRLTQRDQEVRTLQIALEAEQRIAMELRGRLDKLSQRIGELGTELAVVKAERDDWERRAMALERLQTATLVLDEVEQLAQQGAVEASSSTIERLMAELGSAEPATPEERNVTDSSMLLAPELIASDVFSSTNGASDSDAAARGAALPRMIRLDGRSPGMYLIHGKCSTIGRSADTDICIDEACVSRLHARLYRDGSAVVIEDAGSRNGVKVNSERVERRVLQDGDIIGLGRLRLQFIDPNEAPIESALQQ